MSDQRPGSASPADVMHLTRDTFCNGRLVVYQHKAGYRFSIDAILLAGYIRPQKDCRLIDLGCGCGIISLMVAHRFPTLQLFGVEIQPALASLARRNVAENRLGDRILILDRDMKSLSQEMTRGPVDVIFSNPPFGRASGGRINPNMERALARHEIMVSLKELTAITHRMLRTGGRFFTIFPAERITDLLCHMRADRIEPKRIRMVHSYETDPPKRILVEGVAGGQPGVSIGRPLVIYQADGEYTHETQRFFSQTDLEGISIDGFPGR